MGPQAWGHAMPAHSAHLRRAAGHALEHGSLGPGLVLRQAGAAAGRRPSVARSHHPRHCGAAGRACRGARASVCVRVRVRMVMGPGRGGGGRAREGRAWMRMGWAWGPAGSSNGQVGAARRPASWQALTKAPSRQLLLLMARGGAALRRVVPDGLDVVHEAGGEAGVAAGPAAAGRGIRGAAAAAAAGAAAACAARPPRRRPAAPAAAAALPAGAQEGSRGAALLLGGRDLVRGTGVEGAAWGLGAAGGLVAGAGVLRRGGAACCRCGLVLHCRSVLAAARQGARGAWPGLLTGNRGGRVAGGRLAARPRRRRRGGGGRDRRLCRGGRGWRVADTTRHGCVARSGRRLALRCSGSAADSAAVGGLGVDHSQLRQAACQRGRGGQAPAVGAGRGRRCLLQLKRHDTAAGAAHHEATARQPEQSSHGICKGRAGQGRGSKPRPAGR